MALCGCSVVEDHRIFTLNTFPEGTTTINLEDNNTFIVHRQAHQFGFELNRPGNVQKSTMAKPTGITRFNNEYITVIIKNGIVIITQKENMNL